MKKIVTKSLALTPAKQIADSSDLLIGHCCIGECNHMLSALAYVEDKTDTLGQLCVINQIGLDQPFFYQAEVWKSKSVLHFRERGVGTLVSHDDGIHLQRDVVFDHDHCEQNVCKQCDTPHDFGDAPIVIGTFQPKDIYIKYFMPASFMTSHGLICMEPGEFLFVNSEGDFSGGSVEVITEMIRKNKGGLQVGTVKPKKPIQGTIIYNKGTKNFEGYDGKKWRTLGG